MPAESISSLLDVFSSNVRKDLEMQKSQFMKMNLSFV